MFGAAKLTQASTLITLTPSSPPNRGLTTLQSREHLGCMFIRFNCGPDLLDQTVRANEKCDPVNALVFSAHETLLTPHAVIADDFLIRIGQEREWQFIFLRELVVRLYRIHAHAENHRSLPLEIGEVIPKRARFFGAAG